MVKILCIGTFVAGLLTTVLSYTIEYFGLTEEIKQEQENIKNDF